MKGLLLRQVAIGVAKAMLNAVYRVRRRGQRLDETVFLSRQTSSPSYDFKRLAGALEARGWKSTMHLKKVTKRNLLAYAVHVWREIGLLARCKAAVIDRYDPVLSLIDFECEEPISGGVVNGAFPKKPAVIQIWHAFGAYKKFGYQNVGGPEGHPQAFMDDWQIHRNCSWVVCSSEACRRAYAEAFACPESRVVALDRPERDELARLRSKRRNGRSSSGGMARVLMAPTLRISRKSPHPFMQLRERGAAFDNSVDGELIWSFHPLDSGKSAPGDVSESLVEADFVVTDYSSIVYEAYLLGLPTVFYVPDIEEYRLSPGLNEDPLEIAPGLCARDPVELASLLNGFIGDPGTYPYHEFSSFAARAFDERHADGSAESRLADFVIAAADGRLAANESIGT